MSRPPIPRNGPGGRTAGSLPIDYTQLLELQQQIAARDLGRTVPDERTDEADATRTLLEMSALVAHVLSAHQEQYGAEAFIDTAIAGSTMVQHARRLSYQPDPGLAASGYVVLFAKDEVGGKVGAGLPLASVPVGDKAAEDFETIDDIEVRAGLNAVAPWGATRPVRVEVGDTQIRLKGVGHRLAAGDVAALVGPHWQGFIISSIEEDDENDMTTVGIDREIARRIDPPIAAAAGRPAVLVAHPARTLRSFGTNADARLFPPGRVRSAGGLSLANTATATSGPVFWYEVERSDAGGYVESDVYLSVHEAVPLVGSHMMARDGTRLAVYRAAREVAASVSLVREVQQAITTHVVSTTTTEDGFESSLTAVPGLQRLTTYDSATVTAIGLEERSGSTVNRRDVPFPVDWLSGWTSELALAEVEPNPMMLPEPLILAGDHEVLTPGRPLAFASRSDGSAEIVTVRRSSYDATLDHTMIWWDSTGIGSAPVAGWVLEDMIVHGNVVRVSHGRTVSETLGGSDGVTPFQVFELKDSPVSVLVSVQGGRPEIEVRVGEIAWERVNDFALSGPNDQHYRTDVDHNGAMSVVFGDSFNGAVPPSGTSNIRAEYRVGLGRAGDVASGEIARIKRAHKLLDRVANLTPIVGGTEPADVESIRNQAPLFIRTFDRAVSAPDLADLALTIPGIARASARWDQSAGAVVALATGSGGPPSSMSDVRSFLDARRDITIPMSLVGSTPRDVFIDVQVEIDPAHLVQVAKNAVRATLSGDDEEAPGLFTFPARGLGQPAYLSELYERLLREPSVLAVQVLRFSSGPTVVADVIAAAADEWLRLPANNLTVVTIGGSS